jgi:low temperature requirement protein LtrA
MGAMLVVALAVPGAFGDDALLFAVAFLVVRVLHLVLSAIVGRDDPDRIVGRDDPDRLGALLRFAPTAVWAIALAVDYLGPVVIGMGRGWHFAPSTLRSDSG